VKGASVERISRAIFAVALVALGTLTWSASALANSAPSILETSVTNISSSDATLNMRIDPNGRATTYEVMITTPNCPESGCQSISVWFLNGEVPAAAEAQSVSIYLAKADASIIWPNHPYQYKVSAMNSVGTAEAFGKFKIPATPPAPKAPAVESESVSHVTPIDAMLEAQINPNGLGTTFQFKLESGCGMEKPEPGHGICMWIAETPVPPGQIPPSSGDQTVTVDLNAVGVTLRPDTEYRYSVEATNSAGSTMQEPEQIFQQTFKTPSTEVTPEHQLNTGTDGLPHNPSVQSPPATSLSHHKKLKHRRHRRKLHRAKHRG
jgi:hypothetical protein